MRGKPLTSHYYSFYENLMDIVTMCELGGFAGTDLK